jgi:fibronectin-binding autotransporter adhesin
MNPPTQNLKMNKCKSTDTAMKLSSFSLKSLTVIAALVAPVLCAQSWIGGEGDWDNPANWSTGTLPTGSSTVKIDNGGTVIIGDGVVAEGDLVGPAYDSGANSGTIIVQAGGTLNVDRALNVGRYGAGPGVLLQTGGQVNVNENMFVGRQHGSSGIYTISGGSLTVGTNLTIADRSAGTSGVLNIEGGLVRVEGSLRFGNSADTGVRSGELNVSGGILEVGTFIGRQHANVNSVFNWSGGTLRPANEAGFIIGSSLDERNLTSGGTGAVLHSSTAGDAASSITLGGSFTGDGGLTITGGGAIISDAVHTYTGATTVSGGTFQLNANLAGGGNVLVESGAVLSGNALVAGATVVNGTLQPNAGSGIIAFQQGLTLAGVTNLVIGGADRGINYSAIDVLANDGLVFGGDFNVSFLSEVEVGDVFQLFDFMGSATGGFESVTLSGEYAVALSEVDGVWTGTDGGLLFSFSQISGQLSVIPEPSTYAWALGLAAMLMVLLRRQRFQI